uniref:Putative serine/threonine protein kinase n=1 Tax=Pithovirus LCPAC304 TaxID=2506594 RepID=A0A481Z9M3_9VIRU|nr:MAG: putative serine/threonine protein kinase [Pithovirus LCPAC304]
MFLGKGTYGSVRVHGGLAVKKFHDMRHLIQEYLAGSYLDDARNIVRIHEVDLLKLKLSMELYQMNLRHWMEDNGDREKFNDRYFILHEILVGLCEIHGRGLVHGDVKPGNILLNDKPLKVAIADLGFVSLRRYAKVRYTAKVYRDSVVRQSPVHDMWSLGVLMLELFGRIKVRVVCNYDELIELTYQKVKSKTIRNIILSLIDEVPENRPEARDVLYSLFKESVFIQTKEVPRIRAITHCSNAFAYMRNHATEYRLAMIERCIEALKVYIQTHDVPIDDCIPYGIAMMLISSSLYRITKFTLSKALLYIDQSREDFLFYLCNLLANDDVITILLRK